MVYESDGVSVDIVGIVGIVALPSERREAFGQSIYPGTQLYQDQVGLSEVGCGQGCREG